MTGHIFLRRVLQIVFFSALFAFLGAGIATAQRTSGTFATNLNYSVAANTNSGRDAGAPLSSSVTPAQSETITKSSPSEDYTLGSGDKIRVIVFGEDDMGGEFTVDDTGLVPLPLLGQTQATGLTVHQFEVVIAEKLLNAGYLTNPHVSVQVENYRPFYILGEVNKPGEYPFVTGMNLLNAIALAGGYTYRADQSVIYIRRKGASQEEKYPADETTKIFPGDILRVPERFF